MNVTTQYYNKAFEEFIHNKADLVSPPDLNEGYDDNTGSFCFPQGFKGDYTEALKKENLFRREATVMETGIGEGFIQTVCSTATAALTEEGSAYEEQSDTFGTIDFTSYKLASLAKLPCIFVQDRHFEVQQYLKGNFARRFGRKEEDLMLNGTGVNQPTGLLTSAQVGKQTQGITYDAVIDLYFSLKPEYRKSAVWIVNDETALTLRKLKDDSGAYLWNESTGTILGKPVVYSMYMPDADVGNKPIVFGDLSYYWMLQREPLSVRILREKYMANGLIGFVARERIDGKLIRPEAAKTLKITE